MKPKQALRDISVERLIPGMYVVKLDIPWMQSPFMSNKVKIKSEREIALLKKSGAKVATIDLSKSTITKQGASALSKTAQAAANANTSPKKPENKTAPATDDKKSDANKNAEAQEKRRNEFKRSLTAAINLRAQAKKAIISLQNDLKIGKSVSPKVMAPLLSDTLDCLEKNNQALLNLAHVSSRSQKIADHVFSVFCVSLNLALQQKMDAKDIEALGIAALLHEAGWVQMPLQLMGKRKPYSAMELKLIHRHPQIGVDSLKMSALPSLSMRIISEHHELCDGSGYPKKLKMEAIHPLSRLLAVADIYDEKVHQLIDRPGMLPANALRDLYRLAKKGAYDESWVARLITLLGVYPISTAVKLNTDEKGIVREVAADNHLHPVVDIIYGRDGRLLNKVKNIDLAQPTSDTEATHIVEVLDPNNPKHDPKRRLILDI
ncbi:MAG: hypothetical protein COA42_12850 [Alteromonadaceae bacterium]|nr:MAG: hypothetical protein COA42_12850 [Alteromonadaceae bacterium]